ASSYAFSIQSGTLPAGLSLASNGWITGTPTVSGDATFTIQATPDLMFDMFLVPTLAPIVALSRTYTLSVVPAPIVLSPATLPGAIVGNAYSRTITASGGVAPYTFTHTGTLPPGLVLASDGLLSGTPVAAGSYSFVVHATDMSGEVGGQAYDIEVSLPPLVLLPGGVPDGTVGEAYTHQF